MVSKLLPLCLLLALLPTLRMASQNFENLGMELDSILNIFLKCIRLWKKMKHEFPNIPGVNETCQNEFEEQIRLNLTEEYFDASGKPGSGVSEGNIYWLGDYNECMDIAHSKYCTLLNIKVNKKPTIFGVCVPSACDETDVEAVFKWVAKMTGIVFGKDVLTVDSDPLEKYYGPYNVSCTSNDKPETEKWESIWKGLVLALFSIIVLLNLMGSIWHVVRILLSWSNIGKFDRNAIFRNSVNVTDQVNSEIEADGPCATDKHARNNPATLRNASLTIIDGHPATKFFMSFSLILNTKAIFNTSISDDIIKSANGVRFFSLCWIILGHMLFYAPLYAPVDNVVYIEKTWLTRISMQALLNSTVAVDTFFLLSGMLVSYLCFRRLERYRARVSVWTILRYYLHRLVRIWPAYLCVLLFYMFIFPELSAGPFWFPHESKSYNVKNCKDWYWTNIIFINDVYPDINKSCFEWSWYLAVDMQFYVLSPLFVFLIKDTRLLKMLILLVIIIASLSYKGYLLYTLHATPIFNTKSFRGIERQVPNSPLMVYLDCIYTKPWTRITPYLIGMILGYCLRKKKKLPDRWRLILSFSLWSLCVIIAALVVYLPANATDWSPKIRVAYGVLFRPAWALAIAWMVYACHTGYGELLNDLLSWKFFIPFTRLSFSTYLVHVMVIITFYGSLHQSMHMDDTNFFCLYFGITFISYFIGYVVTVFIEYPVYQVIKIF